MGVTGSDFAGSPHDHCLAVYEDQLHHAEQGSNGRFPCLAGGRNFPCLA